MIIYQAQKQQFLYIIGGDKKNLRENEKYEVGINEKDKENNKPLKMILQMNTPQLKHDRVGHSCFIDKDYLFVCFGDTDNSQTIEYLDLLDESGKFKDTVSF